MALASKIRQVQQMTTNALGAEVKSQVIQSAVLMGTNTKDKARFVLFWKTRQ